MKGEWCYFRQIFTPEECDYIIQEGLKVPAKKATLGVEGSATDLMHRNSDVRFFNFYDPQFEFVFDRLWKYAIPANREWFQLNINKLDYIQMATYDESYRGFYNRHVDVFWLNDDPIYHRKLSCVVQLTDPNKYEGGNLEVFNTRHFPDAQDIRQQGTAFFFPSFVEHQATPVTKGTRYSLAAWFDGPKWQ